MALNAKKPDGNALTQRWYINMFCLCLQKHPQKVCRKIRQTLVLLDTEEIPPHAKEKKTKSKVNLNAN